MHQEINSPDMNKERETLRTPLFPSTHSSHLCSQEHAGWGVPKLSLPPGVGNPRYATVSINSFFTSMQPWTGWVGAPKLSLTPGAGNPRYATVSINSFFASMLPWTGWVGAPKLSLPPGAGNPRYATVSINSFFASMQPWTGWVGATKLSLPPGAGNPRYATVGKCTRMRFHCPNDLVVLRICVT